MMKLHQFALAALLAVALVGLLASGAPTAADEDLEQEVTAPEGPAGRSKFQMPKLFDFDNYKRLFKKRYSGLLEELARKRYFLSRALRAFLSAVKYKYRQATFYLAVNHMSDQSPEELELMRNRALEEAPVSRPLEAAPTSEELDLPEVVPAEGEDVESELRNYVAAHKSEPGTDELRRVLGHEPAQRRQSGEQPAEGQQQQQQLRQLPLARLINTGDEHQLDPETAEKVRLVVASDNPDYEPPELASFGLADEVREVKFYDMKAPIVTLSRDSLSNTLWGSLGALKAAAWGAETEPKDTVHLDLRDTKCFFMPRQQGGCGSCYAFAMMSVIEWHYCMHTGKLVAFSEQYMMDCGKQYVDGIDGCSGGNPWATGTFVHNFGLELRTKYPYMKREQQCPYEPATDMRHTGYIRFEFKTGVQVPVGQWPRVLKTGPLLLAISLGPGFHEYGGGVHGSGCSQEKATHAVVLIGHGREDGREYWLIRNSHSVGWGEGGYYKLDKEAGCVPNKVGYMYASLYGDKVEPRIRTNKRNDPLVIKSHYANTMLML